MPILRHTDSRYTKISNSVLQSSNISLKAKGLLCYMLSCSDNWKFAISTLATACGESKYSIEQALGELETFGYHKKELKKDNGRFKEWEYWVSDIPEFLNSPDFDLPNQKTEPIIKITNSKKEYNKKKEKKENLFEKCSEIIDKKFTDIDVKEYLHKYLRFRITVGLTVEQWIAITEELFTLATTKEEALEVIDKSYKNNWRSFFPIKKTYSKSNAYQDTVPKTEKTEDGKLRDLYREEFCMLPVKERPSFEKWVLERNCHDE